MRGGIGFPGRVTSMTKTNHSGVVYKQSLPEASSSITYIDPKNPPGHRALFLRGLFESSWCLLFSIVLVPIFCIANSVLELAELPHVHVVVAGFVGALVTYFVFLPFFLLSAKETRKAFVKLGGDPAGISLLMFWGMIPLGKSHWHTYRFLVPAERKRLIAASAIKPVTGPFF